MTTVHGARLAIFWDKPPRRRPANLPCPRLPMTIVTSSSRAGSTTGHSRQRPGPSSSPKAPRRRTAAHPQARSRMAACSDLIRWIFVRSRSCGQFWGSTLVVRKGSDSVSLRVSKSFPEYPRQRTCDRAVVPSVDVHAFSGWRCALNQPFLLRNGGARDNDASLRA
jgi:hypothetical protein